MKPSDKEQHEYRSQARRILAEFRANGLGALKPAERDVLHAEILAHVIEVDWRCQRGEGLHVNSPLRRLLTQDLEEIENDIKARHRAKQTDRGFDMER